MNNKSDFIGQKGASPSPRPVEPSEDSDKSQINTLHVPEYQVITIQKVTWWSNFRSLGDF